MAKFQREYAASVGCEMNKICMYCSEMRRDNHKKRSELIKVKIVVLVLFLPCKLRQQMMLESLSCENANNSRNSHRIVDITVLRIFHLNFLRKALQLIPPIPFTWWKLFFPSENTGKWWNLHNIRQNDKFFHRFAKESDGNLHKYTRKWWQVTKFTENTFNPLS